MKLCMGCMKQIEDHYSTCPYCGFNEITMRQESYYLDPGTVVGGKYIVGRVLNYGGHTVSYLGMDAEKNRKIIVKEYLPSDFSTRSEGEKDVTIYSGDGQEQFEQGLTNFLNEANRIQHLHEVEGIAKVYDCVAENETGYVISEYVEGKTLKEILDGGKKYSVEETVVFVRKILQGLSKVHRMDIVHCDISPETIMVTNTGDIKLIDFGATRYVTTANSKSLSIILKRGYAPEEQYRSKGRRGPWTDVYALGAVMYRMITGIVPQESVERALEDDLKEPSKLGISISKSVENAMMNALNVYQEERTPSAEVFLNELESENVKRIKVKQRKNKTGKFPLWAKGLVAGLACVAAIGGVYVIRSIKGTDSNLNNSAILMRDLRNKSQEEALEIIEKLNDDNPGWNIQLDVESTVFDLTKISGTVCTQSVQPGTVLFDPEKEIQDEASLGLMYDSDGNLSGTIRVKLYSNSSFRYDEIRGITAYEMAKKLEIDPEDKVHFVEEEGKEGNNYYDLAYMEVGGEKISAKELEKKKNKNKIIDYSKDIKIHYYATDFFYWKELPDFAGEYGVISQVPEQKIYRYADEKTKKESGIRSLLDSNMVDNGYYAIASKGYTEGQIIGQTVKAGEEYNESKPGDNTLKIRVIGTLLDYAGKTGRQFVEELTEQGFGYFGYQTSSGAEGQADWRITDVKVYPAIGDKRERYDETNELPYFKNDGSGDDCSIFFAIMVKAPETEAPKSGGDYLPSYPSTPGGNGNTPNSHNVGS